MNRIKIISGRSIRNSISDSVTQLDQTQHWAHSDSGGLGCVALVGRRHGRRALLRCGRHDYKTLLGFAFDWTGDKLAVCLVWLAPQAVFEACLCSSP